MLTNVLDCLAPKTFSIQNIRDRIAQKVAKQAGRLILNLDDSNASVKDIRNYLFNVDPVWKLKEIIVVKNDQVISLYP